MSNRSVTYSADAVFVALADPTRRAVLDLLRRREKHAGAIADEFTVSRPAISRHLRQLRRSRLVIERREGRRRVYRFNPQPLRVVDSWLDRYREFWTTRLRDLKAFAEAGTAGKTAGSKAARTRTRQPRART